MLSVQPQSTESTEPRDQTRKANGMAVAETTTEARSSGAGNDSDVGRKAVGEARKVVSESASRIGAICEAITIWNRRFSGNTPYGVVLTIDLEWWTR